MPSSSPGATISRSDSVLRSRAIGSRAFQPFISSSVRGSGRFARMLCWPQRQVSASIRLGPSPARARATASPTASCTASTSLPSIRDPGMPYAAARAATDSTAVLCRYEVLSA